MSHKLVHPIADSVAAGAAVGFGARILAEVDLIISIVAGLLVAFSAGLSVYLNWKKYKEEQAEKTDPE